MSRKTDVLTATPHGKSPSSCESNLVLLVPCPVRPVPSRSSSPLSAARSSGFC
ncbi:hypothetical protein M404DRAFT_994792 [Pisolithus tinctorius Marx 270]|uniref:Uncharacterized protein n=1 Tax=Pisolithus tinctorius Marx 270 TaxID=870435 RepID=A0A0C3PQ63_PISTI|nr:hypothetical protein M404DRAFT_994792 [Pisolithus tinctorius Marx 270]